MPVEATVVGKREPRKANGGSLGRHHAIHGAAVRVVERERVAGVEPAQLRVARVVAVLAVDACGVLATGRGGVVVLRGFKF